MDHVESCVIGAGVVGLAIAAKLAARSQSLLILDGESHYGQGVSSRNSEVIHAGIYYPKNSLKALLCCDGKRKLYAYCEKNKVSHQRIGKLIVATQSDEVDTLNSIQSKADENGVDDLQFWSKKQLAASEPDVRAVEALFSKSTGIISCHDLMTTYLAEAESHGASFAPQSRVVGLDISKGNYIVEVQAANNESFRFSCRNLVNAAGLGAQKVAALLASDMVSEVPPLYLCKGSYFSLTGRSPFQHLIYPVPETSGAGLGVHATLDLGGQVKFGPDVEYIETDNYAVSEDKQDGFYEAIRRYYPALPDGSLLAAYAGIRPKLQAQGEIPRDFEIQGQAVHGLPNMVQLFGIESPGLTASIAIADHVMNLLPAQ